MTARRVVVETPWRAPGEVGDLDDALERVGDPPVDQEVDVDRGVVPGDRGLARDLDELLAHVDLDRPIDDRDQEVEARARGPSIRSVLPRRKTTIRSYCCTTRIDR